MSKNRKAKYPQVIVEWSTRQSRHEHGQCDECKCGVNVQARYCTIETRVDWFRGNDEVRWLCAGCAAKAGHVDPKLKKQQPRPAEGGECLSTEYDYLIKQSTGLI